MRGRGTSGGEARQASVDRVGGRVAAGQGGGSVAVDGEQLQSENDLSRIISSHKPGDQVEVEVIRDGEHQTIDVTLQARPSRPPSNPFRSFRSLSNPRFNLDRTSRSISRRESSQPSAREQVNCRRLGGSR